VALDGAGNLYIADTTNNRVRKVWAATGDITTVAGTGALGHNGDNGPATKAELNGPWGVTVDVSGNLFIGDTLNQRIRKVDIATGIITTVAGNGFQGSGGAGGFAGDNGPATAAELSLPYAVAFDSTGNMYIPDSANNRIRKVDTTGTITTYAGTGNPGLSGDGGPATGADLHLPEGVAVDPADNLYIADTQNSSIRKVSSKTQNITTIAQSGQGVTVVPSGTTPEPVVLYAPIGMAFDAQGDLFVADYYYMLVREVQSNLAILDFEAVPVREGDISAPQNQTVENDGNANLDISAINHDNNSAVDQALTTCNLGTPFLAVDGDCIIAAEFAPSVSGNPLLANIDVLGDAVNSPLDIELIGNASAVNSTTVSLTSNHNPSNFGQAVTFTATVTTGANTGNLTGTLVFMDGAKQLGVPVNLSAAGIATYTTRALAVGSHNMTAVYNGDSKHFGSTSPILIQVVNEGTVTKLTSSLNPSQIGQNVTFTATVKASGGVAPDGNVVFTDGATTLGTVALAAGVATYSTAALTNGLHIITATYVGDPVNDILSSTSNVVDQEVQAPTTNVLTSAPNPSVFGTNVTFTATVKSSGAVTPIGAVDFLDGAKVFGSANLAGATGVATFTTATLGVGSHTITAVYKGSASNAASTSNVVTQVVNPADTQTTVVAFPNPGIAGQPVKITATVKLTLGIAIPTGNVTFKDGGVLIGTAPLGAAGTAAITASFVAGKHDIVASYVGNTNNGPSNSAVLTLIIDLATDAVSLTVAPNPAVVGTKLTMTAQVKGDGATPTGIVKFIADGTAIGIGVLNNTASATLTYSALTVGNHAITAEYEGDKLNALTTSETITEVVQAIPTVTDLGAASVGKSQTLVASVFPTTGTGPTPTGTVTFTSSGNVIGKSKLDSSSVATLAPNLPSGNYSIVASYGGDSLHLPSQSKAVVISGSAAGFSIAVHPTTLSIQTTGKATLAVDLTSTGGFTDNIGLGCGSLPVAVTCHFQFATKVLTADGTVSDQLIIDTNSPLTGGQNALNRPSGAQNTVLAGIFLPLSAFFGFVFWRFRKRHPRLLAMVLLAVLSGAAMLVTGCGGFTEISAKPGTYVIQVNGVGHDTNVSEFHNVTLTITQ
jgi:large repetitive protein